MREYKISFVDLIKVFVHTKFIVRLISANNCEPVRILRVGFRRPQAGHTLGTWTLSSGRILFYGR